MVPTQATSLCNFDWSVLLYLLVFVLPTYYAINGVHEKLKIFVFFITFLKEIITSKLKLTLNIDVTYYSFVSWNKVDFFFNEHNFIFTIFIDVKGKSLIDGIP